MSQLNSGVCLDLGSGRPQNDAAYQNFKAANHSGGAKLFACEVSTAAAVVGELIADTGAFNTLTVENLTVTGPSSGEPSVVSLPSLLAVASGTAAYTVGTRTYDLLGVGDSFSWTLNVPASSSRVIKFNAGAGAGLLFDVTVNGVSVPLAAAYTASAVNSTSPFIWGGGSMTVVFTSGSAGAPAADIIGDPLVV